MGNLFKKQYPMSNGPRQFVFPSEQLYFQTNFTTNFIITSKYNIISFWPLAILLQFKRYANIYFLLIAIIQSIPIISPLSPFSSWAPLCFVLFVSLVREGIEDFYRHRSDKELNASISQVYSEIEKKFIQKNWGEILVGDLVLLKTDENIPADIIVLASSIESGACFIETASLDGEKALKPKLSVLETVQFLNPEGGFEIKGEINCQIPDPNLHHFEGALVFNENKIFLSIKQLILRGAVLRNTKWVIGIVVCTGEDTKIMKNSSVFRYKQSNIEKILNNMLVYVLLFEVVCCLVSSILCGYWTDHSLPWYISFEYDGYVEGILIFFTYLILNSTMIPISLIVSLELVKLAQGYFISVDEDLYSKIREKHAKVSTTSINEELGQIEYIFTDKTGTLTCNEMKFKYCMIGEQIYGEKVENIKNHQKLRKKMTNAKNYLKDYMEWFKDRKVSIDENESLNRKEEITGFDERLKEILENNNGGKLEDKKILEIWDQGKISMDFMNEKELVHEFLKILAICHECLCDIDDKNIMKYQGPSPDEIALVDFARSMGYIFLGISKNFIQLEILSKTVQFEILHTFEFNSDRKRMSIIIKDHDVIKLYIKGADNVIKDRLDKINPQPFLQKIEFSLDDFSRLGLRTLCIAFRIISKKEYQDFHAKYEALLTVENREAKIFELAETIEKDLYLLGATIVEDRLQDGVPEVLNDFLRANIKVWMLTGDKLETAENIGKSCSLIQEEFTILRLSFPQISSEEIKAKLIETYEIIKLNIAIKKKKGLLVEGGALSQIFSDEILKDIFIDIIENCETVICCRVTPKQKAEVVKLVKDYLGKITLAIGDGSNDVNMIQEAHIGVGVFGLEGMRAVQVSDFAIGEFKYLWKLVLVHGRWCYLRISEMILYFFYKNMAFTIIQCYFSFVCAYSGQSIYDDSYIVFFNLIFTSLPLMVRAIMEKDVYYMIEKNKYEKVQRYELKELKFLKKIYPKFYYKGQQNKLFNTRRYISWVLQGLSHGAIIFGFCCIVFYYNIIDIKGLSNDLWIFSIYLYTCLIVVVDIKLAAYTQSWTGLFIGTLVITSLVFYFSYIFIASEIQSLEVYDTSLVLYSSPSFYFLMFMTVGLVFIFDLLVIYLKQNYKQGFIEKGKVLMKNKNLEEEEVQKEIIFDMLASQLKNDKEKTPALTEEIPFKNIEIK